jgi:hypothetical protein
VPVAQPADVFGNRVVGIEDFNGIETRVEKLFSQRQILFAVGVGPDQGGFRAETTDFTEGSIAGKAAVGPVNEDVTKIGSADFLPRQHEKMVGQAGRFAQPLDLGGAPQVVMIGEDDALHLLVQGPGHQHDGTDRAAGGVFGGMGLHFDDHRRPFW